MKLSTIVVVLLVSLTLAVQASAADPRIALRLAARPMLNQERFEEAIALYVDAGQKSEDDALQAHCFVEASEIARVRLKDPDRALELAEQIRDPQRKSSRQLIVLAHAERFDQVREVYGEAVIGEWPIDTHLDSYNARANAYLAAEEFDKALADLEKASDSPGDAGRRVWSLYHLGQLYETKLNDADKALATYTRALEVTPGTYAWRNRSFLRRGYMLLERGQPEEAIKAYDGVDYAQLPNDFWRGEFYLLHAKVQSELGHHGQAATLLTSVIRLPQVNNHHKAAAEARLAEITGKLQAQ